eukprot:scaffold7070_cov73-Skeletonema_dohrnii-CCMP3373.AAC.2
MLLYYHGPIMVARKEQDQKLISATAIARPTSFYCHRGSRLSSQVALVIIYFEICAFDEST